jgi:hypothetical protein
MLAVASKSARSGEQAEQEAVFTRIPLAPNSQWRVTWKLAKAGAVICSQRRANQLARRARAVSTPRDDVAKT